MAGDPVGSDEPSFDFNPFNLPPEYLRAVGLVSAAASATEWIVGELIGGLLGIDAFATRALTSHMAVPLRDNIARSLVELKAEFIDQIDDLDDLLDAVDAAFDLRNTILHNSIIIERATGQVFSYRISSRGNLKGSLQPISAEAIEQDAAAIHDAGLKLYAFMMERDWLPRDNVHPLSEPFSRKKKARDARRASGVRYRKKID
jgi:hypothetical protein